MLQRRHHAHSRRPNCSHQPRRWLAPFCGQAWWLQQQGPWGHKSLDDQILWCSAGQPQRSIFWARNCICIQHIWSQLLSRQTGRQTTLWRKRDPDSAWSVWRSFRRPRKIKKWLAGVNRESQKWYHCQTAKALLWIVQSCARMFF